MDRNLFHRLLRALAARSRATSAARFSTSKRRTRFSARGSTWPIRVTPAERHRLTLLAKPLGAALSPHTVPYIRSPIRRAWLQSVVPKFPPRLGGSLCVLGLLLVASCGEAPTPLGHGYTRKGEHVHFEGGGSTGADGGTRIDKPSEANIKGFQDALGRTLPLCTNPDVASFEALSEEYCRDRNKVYYKWISPGRFLMIELPGADVASFRALSLVFAVDVSSVWYMDQPIAGSDPRSFVIIDDRIGKDRNHVYFSGERAAQFDAASFRHLGSGYFADKDGVYWGTDSVAGADLETFEVLDNSFVAKDKDRVYRSGQVLDSFDAATTKLLLHDPYGYQFTSDRNGVYVNGLKFLHADPADFTMRDNRCGVGSGYLFFVDVWHSTPITLYRENGGLVAETILYERETGRGLAIVRADLTEGGMQNVELSPPPGAEAAGSVPAWQMDLFRRLDLASSLREKARTYLP